MNTTEVLEKIKSLVAEIEVEHSKTTKKSKAVTRKLMQELKQTASEFRKLSIAESK
jgi:hypothetical protein